MKKGVNKANLLVLFYSVFAFLTYGQEVKYRSDYDLNGPVKKCTVLTPYGKEIYSFSEDGKLSQLTSFFDKNNFQQLKYTYKDNVLIQRRIELYDMGELDQSASVINVYQNNGTSHLQKEIIADYNGNTLENIIYVYDSIFRLKELKKLTNNGYTSTLFSSAVDSLGVYKSSILVDSLLRQSTDSIPKAFMHNDSLTEVRTIHYLDGFEDTAELKKYNSKGFLVYLKKELYLIDADKWYREREEKYQYNEKGQMIQKISREGNTSFTQKYVYQNDGSQYQNWVKQIVMPNMTYTTRIIEYFEDN